jgi:hypothetical protein
MTEGKMPMVHYQIQKNNINLIFTERKITRRPNLLITILLLGTFCYASQNCIDSKAQCCQDSISRDTLLQILQLDSNICITIMEWPYKDSVFIVYAEDNSKYYVYMLKQVKRTIVKKITATASKYGSLPCLQCLLT